MGWLLTRNSGKKKRKKTRGHSTEPRWDPQRTLMAVKVLGSAAVVVGLVVGWYFTQRGLAHYAATHHAVPIQPEQVQLRDAPDWMSEAARMELRQLVAQHAGTDPVSNTSLRRTAQALRHSAWVRSLSQVRRLHGGRIAVRAAYRRPMAIIEARDGYHLVDHAGVRLEALHEASAAREHRLPMIVGVGAAPPRSGERWPGGDVQAGLDLAELVRGKRWADQVRAVDVGLRDDRGRLRLVLHTDDGQVRWGAPPGEGEPVEPAAEVKLQWLDTVASKYDGQIDAGGQIVEIFGATVQMFEPRLEGRSRLGTFTTSGE